MIHMGLMVRHLHKGCLTYILLAVTAFIGPPSGTCINIIFLTRDAQQALNQIMCMKRTAFFSPSNLKWVNLVWYHYVVMQLVLVFMVFIRAQAH